MDGLVDGWFSGLMDGLVDGWFSGLMDGLVVLGFLAGLFNFIYISKIRQNEALLDYNLL